MFDRELHASASLRKRKMEFMNAILSFRACVLIRPVLAKWNARRSLKGRCSWFFSVWYMACRQFFVFLRRRPYELSSASHSCRFLRWLSDRMTDRMCPIACIYLFIYLFTCWLVFCCFFLLFIMGSNLKLKGMTMLFRNWDLQWGPAY